MEVTLAALLQVRWGVPQPIHLEELTTGVNNHAWLVYCPNGSYVLKRYVDPGDPVRLGFELALLARLASAGLPFAVPAPVRALNGDPVVESGGHRLVLAHRIPGDPGWRADLLLTRRCGHALALLDLALATVTLAVGAPETYRRLDLDAAVRSVEAEFAGSGLASAIAEVLDRTDEQWSRVTAGWPVQLVHADYFPPNVLVVNGDVTGVIDFEFAGNGFRAMDFAIGLIAFGTERWEFRTSWELLEAFASGYLAVNPLSPEERAEVPALILMREASSYTHWLGRLARGMIAPEEIQARGRRLLDLDRWLSAYGDDLITRLARIDRC